MYLIQTLSKWKEKVFFPQDTLFIVCCTACQFVFEKIAARFDA